VELIPDFGQSATKSIDDYPIQLLQIHHLGYPHEDTKLRIQIRPDNVIQLRGRKLIVGVYSIQSIPIYAIFDPCHIASLNFKSTTSINISIEDINLCYNCGPILKKDKLDSVILLLNDSTIREFLNFFNHKSGAHNLIQWRQIMIDWFSLINKFNIYSKFNKFVSHVPDPDNYNNLKTDYPIKMVRISDFNFKLGFKQGISLIVDNNLANYLTYEQHFVLIINKLNFGDAFIDELTNILRDYPNPFFEVKQDRIVISFDIEKYYGIVSEFLSSQYLSCSTSRTINDYIRSQYPTISIDFYQVKSNRFKERIIAGKSDENESYYFDANNNEINDIVHFAKSYSSFLSEQFKKCNNIFDLYMTVYSIDKQADCYIFWSAFKRTLRSENFDYIDGAFSTIRLPDKRKEIILREIKIFLDQKNSNYISLRKEVIIGYKLNSHFLFRYMMTFFPYVEDKYTLNFEVEVVFVNNSEVSGFCVLGKESGIALFPLVAPEAFRNRSEDFFFCFNSKYYYITENKGIVNLQVI
jgi:hypothetical protein